MYVGTHYNSYYNSLYGTNGSAGSIYQTGKKSGSGSGLYGLQQQLGVGSGVYNQSAFSSDALKYVQTLKTAGSGLSSALKGLSSGAAFRQQGAVSSDKSVLTVSDSGRNINASQMAKSVKVDQVAAAQVDEGSKLNANGRSGVSGYQQVAIEVDGKVSQISFQAKAGETNQQLQQRMADAINARGIGVTASVQTDSKAGTSQLVLTGKEAGRGKGCEVAGVSGQAFAELGMGNTTQQAQDAQYSLDGGKPQTSSTNSVNIGGGVTAILKKAGSESVSISRGVDSDFAIKKAEEMASQYNSLYGAALGNTSDNRANRLFNDLVSNSRTYTSSLAKVGINFDGNGYMTIDKDKMAAAAEDGSLEAFFTENAGRSYGFQNNLGRIADRADNNTNQYASASSFTQSTGNNLYANSYANSISTLTSSLFGSSAGNGSSGWLFDFLL